MMTDLSILQELENWFDAEIHRTVRFKAYPHEMGTDPVVITVYVSRRAYLLTATTGDKKPIASNTHPTLEAAVANLAAHADRIGLELRSRG